MAHRYRRTKKCGPARRAAKEKAIDAAALEFLNVAQKFDALGWLVRETLPIVAEELRRLRNSNPHPHDHVAMARATVQHDGPQRSIRLSFTPNGR
jgi:hypothetical protein